MNKAHITKESIKKDLLKNIDKMVDDIYNCLQTPPFSINLDDASFIIEGNPYKEMSLSDTLSGKQACPISLPGKDALYLEVNIDAISKKIRLTEEIFRHLYKFTFTKDMTVKDIPSEIMNILEIYEMHEEFQRNNNSNANSTNKWLLGVALFGSMRFLNKTNNPYITNKEAKNIVKGFIKNMKMIYYVINEKYALVDDNNVGIQLFDCLTPTKISIEKI